MTSPEAVSLADWNRLTAIPPSEVPLGALFTNTILSSTVSVTLSMEVVVPSTSKFP